MPATAKTFRSPSKLNLFLEVLGRRDDGFHELETVMVRTDFCDELAFTEAENGGCKLAVAGAPELARNVPVDESNLILRAVREFQRAANVSTEWKIDLLKAIPMEAGLAGGSGNAATTLIVLNELCGNPLSRVQLHQIAAGLGSDINFFVEDCVAGVCTGRGEQVQAIEIAGPFHFVVARPSTGNSTPAVFNKLNHSDQKRDAAKIIEALQAGSVPLLQDALFNRLTAAACELNSPMKSLLQQLATVCGRPAAMSGSGSTCYVCCHDEADANVMLHRVQTLKPDFAAILRTL